MGVTRDCPFFHYLRNGRSYTNFKFRKHISRLDRSKCPLQILGKVAMTAVRESRTFSAHPHIGRIARSSLRQLGFLVVDRTAVCNTIGYYSNTGSWASHWGDWKCKCKPCQMQYHENDGPNRTPGNCKTRKMTDQIAGAGKCRTNQFWN